MADARYATVGSIPPRVKTSPRATSPRSAPRAATPSASAATPAQKPKRKGVQRPPEAAPSGGSKAAVSRWLEAGVAASNVASVARQATLTELVSTVTRGGIEPTVA